MKHPAYKLLIVTLAFGFGIVFPRLTPALLSTNLLDANNPYMDYGTWEEAVIAYHVEANAITNTFLEQLSTGENTDVSFPGSPEGCTSSNVSTYCLAVALNQELSDLELFLGTQRDAPIQVEAGSDFTQTLNQLTINNQDMEKEIQAARGSLDLTLAVYNQAQLIYPVHQSFVELQKSLEAFRDALAKVRDTIEPYPGRFNDALTITCQ